MKDSMLAIWKKRPEKGLQAGEAPIPRISDEEVLIQVKATSICGTDRHIYNWDDWAQKRIAKRVPYVFGHEMAGEIVEIGKNVRGLAAGDHVSAETHIACGYCYQCRTGAGHICKNVRILGVDTHGTFAEYVALPYQNAWKNDPTLPHWQATAQEPLGNAVHTVFDGEIAGKIVTIFGMGPIGVCAVGVARAAGAQMVIAIDPHDYRLGFARKFGADVTFNTKDMGEKLTREIMAATDGLGADVFLEMAGSASAMRDGLGTLKPGGRASILGVFKEPFPVDMNAIVFGAYQVHGINGRKMFDTWYKSAALLRSKKIDLGKLVTHRLKLDEIENGFGILEKGEGMKVVLEP